VPELNGAGDDSKPNAELRRFFHDVATPLSAISLHLERASRLAARGEDPREALEVVREQLNRALGEFERWRAELLG
jgi:signal transduction histidine kinase